MRRLKQELPKEQCAGLKPTLWPFRKRAADVAPPEREHLGTLLAYSPALQLAYTLREQLTAIFDIARSKAAY